MKGGGKMTGATHLVAGALAGALAGRFVGSPAAGMAVGAVSALLPDVDHPGSWAGRWLRPLAVALEMAAGHRTVTHTVWFCAAVAALAGLAAAALGPYAAALGLARAWPSLRAAVYAALGSLSHLALDACTRSGVEPFAPLRLPPWLWWLEHPRGPVTTGGLGEVFVLIALGLATVKVAASLI